MHIRFGEAPHLELGENTKLKQERGISFEMAMEVLAKGAYKVIPTPSKSHPKQKMYLITLLGIRRVVPFTEHADHIFLHTIMRFDP